MLPFLRDPDSVEVRMCSSIRIRVDSKTHTHTQKKKQQKRSTLIKKTYSFLLNV